MAAHGERIIYGEQYYDRMHQLILRTTNKDAGTDEDEQLARNIVVLLHKGNCQQVVPPASRKRARPLLEPEDISIIIGHDPSLREWAMALVRLKLDGVSVLIKGGAKKERRLAWRGLLEAVDRMMWETVANDGGAKRKAADGNLGIKRESSSQ